TTPLSRRAGRRDLIPWHAVMPARSAATICSALPVTRSSHAANRPHARCPNSGDPTASTDSRRQTTLASGASTRRGRAGRLSHRAGRLAALVESHEEAEGGRDKGQEDQAHPEC